MAIKDSQSSRVFPPTHWPSILLAGQHPLTAGYETLSRLLQAYRSPLLAHLKWRLHIPDEQAEDWLHVFIEKKVLERNLLRVASQERGRFRTFLLNALDNFVQDELRQQNRLKRKPEGGWVPLDGILELQKASATPSGADPFDLFWAKTVVKRAVQRLQEFYAAKDRLDLWGIFQAGFLRPTLDEEPPPTMTELAQRFGFLSAIQASNGLTTAKRMFKRMLESVVAEYAHDQGYLEQEIAELIAVLSGSN